MFAEEYSKPKFDRQVKSLVVKTNHVFVSVQTTRSVRLIKSYGKGIYKFD